jgi:hypothetical protein
MNNDNSNLKNKKSKPQSKNQICCLPFEVVAWLACIHLLSLRCGFEI